MNIYIVSYWVPFPKSEYGGLLVFAAESRAELKSMMVDMTGDYHKSGNWLELIDIECAGSKEIPVLESFEIEKGLVSDFTT